MLTTPSVSAVISLGGLQNRNIFLVFTSAFKFLGNSLMEMSFPKTLVCIELFSSMPMYLYIPIQFNNTILFTLFWNLRIWTLLLTINPFVVKRDNKKEIR